VEPERDEDRLFRVGDLASSAGLTVRTLHHYEAIGLVTASRRSSAGHRLYGPAAVERLYRVSLLRQLGLSLDQIASALDDPEWALAATLRHHAGRLGREIERVAKLRSTVQSALSDLDDTSDAMTELLQILKEMKTATNPIRRRISILVYRDLRAMHAFLVDVFAMTPGEVTESPDGDVVHAELYAGDGEIWLHPETDVFRLAAPLELGATTSTTAVMVDDVDAHHALAQSKGAEIVYPPVDQPYGYREYSARDPEGGLWSFMKELNE